MKNEWRPVVGYETHYEVSNYGMVRRLYAASGTQAGAMLSGIDSGHGYLRIALCVKGVSKLVTINSMVMAAFTGPRPAGHVINHKDGIKRNNRHDNLEYVTSEQNVHHAVKTGLIKTTLTEELRGRIYLKWMETGWSSRRLGELFGVSHTSIQLALKGGSWKDK